MFYPELLAEGLEPCQVEEVWLVPTAKRSIIELGPARSVKGDPLGIARREVE